METIVIYRTQIEHFLLSLYGNFQFMSGHELQLEISPHLLWEYDLDTFDFDNSKDIIIERVIQRGNLKDWQIIVQKYGKQALLYTAEHSKQLSGRDRNFTKILINSPLINAA